MAAGGRAVAVEMDVTDPDRVRAAFASAREALGGIDILVSGAGIAPAAPLVSTTDEVWRQVLETNLSGAFYCLREALPEMTARGLGPRRAPGLDRGQDGLSLHRAPTPPASTACSA